MKTRGHILVKISSVVFILYGAAALLAFVLSLMSAEAAEEYGLGYNLVAGANIAGFKKVATAMVEQGVIDGVDGKLLPRGNVTRAQVAKMLYAME